MAPVDGKVEISIIVPIWNEEDWVQDAYHKINSYIVENTINAQIIFATDGCTDKTIEIIEELMKKNPNLLLINESKKLGRGLALKKVIKKVKTKYIVYMDSDLATDLNHFLELIQHLDKGADIVTGSRLMKDSNCIRSKKRTFFSIIYNFLCLILFGSKLRDHQCGFKGFNRESVVLFIHEVENNSWSWDTEILIRSQKRKLKIVEFPVSWEDPKAKYQSKVNVWKDSKIMGKNLLILRWKLFSLNIQQLIKFSLVGIINTLITFFVLWSLDISIGRDLWSYAFAYFLGSVNSFFMNKRFTFNQKEISKKTLFQFILFLLTSLIGMIVYTFVSNYVESILLISYRFGFVTLKNYIIAGFIGTIFNFFIQFLILKFTIFKNKKLSF